MMGGWRPIQVQVMLVALASVLGASLLQAAPAPAPVLFFEKTSELQRTGSASTVRIVRLRLGDEILDLVRDSSAVSRMPRQMAIVVNDMEQAYLWLRRNRIRPASPAPDPHWNADTGEIRTVHFQDPDGHRLVLVQFPAGKGSARWQRPADRVFLGIDRSAAS